MHSRATAIFIAVAAMIATFSISPAHAENGPVGSLSVSNASDTVKLEWMTRVWRTSDGLPANDILDLRETPDGYLWLGTYQGLVRFDGLRFKSYFNTPTGQRYSARMGPLEVDRRGSLWIVPDQVGMLRRDTAGFTEVLTNETILKSHVVSLCSDGKDQMYWVGGNGNAGWFAIDNPEQPHTIPDARATMASRWFRDFEGKMWLADVRWLRVLDGDVWRNIGTGTSPLIVFPCRSGGMWIARDATLRFAKSNGTEQDVADFPWRGVTRVTSMFEDRWNRLWIGTLAEGLFCYERGEIKQVIATANSISCLTDDEHGNVWVGTRGGGLFRIRPRQFFIHNRATGLENEFVRSLAEDGAGRVWMSCADGRIGWWERNVWHPIGEAEGWRNYDSLGILPASDGTVWFSTIHRGIWRWRNGKVVRQMLKGAVPREPVVDFLEDSKKRVWMVTDNSGVFYFDGVKVLNSRKQGLEMSRVHAVVEDENGDIWAGDWEGSLARFHDGHWEIMRPPSSHADSVRCLVASKDGIWVGTSNGGLLRYKKGKTTRFSMEQGLPNFCVQQLVFDSDRVWAGTSHELFQAPVAQLNELADGKRQKVDTITYGQSDGLPDVSFASACDPKCCRAADGQLWFATASGAVHFQPSDLRESKVPHVAIDEMLLNGKPVDVAALHHLRPGAGRLEFRFAAPCLTAPERVRYRYQLEGVDPDWSDSVAETSIAYASVPAAGSYSFRVMASSPEGVWSPDIASVGIVVHPFFWQTNWFIALIAAVVAGGMVWLVRLATVRRLRLRVQQLHQQQAIERERARIAQDIHDELGANLTSIGLLADMGRRHKADAEAVTRDLGQISETARESVAAMDAIVWALNPRNDSLDNFANYIAQFTRDFFRPTQLRTRLNLPTNLPDRPMSTEMRHELLLVVKESFNNIVRHAAASEVSVELACENGHLKVVIVDDGKGLRNRIAAEGQDGLLNVRERIHRMGGTVEISSNNGHGTKVELHVPIMKTKAN